MRKLWSIIWKENYETFTDRNGLLIMIVTPLALSLIVTMAFSGLSLGGGDINIGTVPVGIVNLDQGSDLGSFGEFFALPFLPPDDAASAEESAAASEENPAATSEGEDSALWEMFALSQLDDEAEARTMVESGELVAVLIIPPDFSTSLMLDQEEFSQAMTADEPLIGHAGLTLYWNSGSQLGWTIFRDVVQGVANSIAAGNIASNVALNGLFETDPRYMIGGLFSSDVQQEINTVAQEVSQGAAAQDANPIRLSQIDVQGQTVELDPLSTLGLGFAIFFTGFTTTFGATSILQEQRNWTLQRLMITPTPRIIILLGKMLAVFVSGVLQMTILMVALTVMSSIMNGELKNIWGNNIPGVIVVVLATVTAATGVGAIISALAKTPEQAGNFGSLIMIVMGMASGTFFTLPDNALTNLVSRLTFHRWGREAFEQLALNRPFGDVALNIAVLLTLGVVFFGIGAWLFNRRIEA